MKPSHKHGFTLVEVMIVVAIIALLAAIAIPNVLRGRTSANESASIGNLRAVVSSLEMYRSVNSTFPDAWQGDMYDDADPDFGPPSFNAELDASVVQGFEYTYTPLPADCSGDAAAPCADYTIEATPQAASTGTRSFFVDSSGTVRHCLSGADLTAAAATDLSIDQPPVDCGGGGDDGG